ncbi:MAG TPA: LuxR family transcriptional regulator [Pseudonocardia sp.]|nr:LuxR family transcriptional regulator [Pseudonocardia sp.]
MLGRTDELDRIGRLLADARTGAGGSLVIRGEAGIGKTALLDHATATAAEMRVARPHDRDPVARLTPQERQVVRLAAAGLSNRDIASQLFLSPRTVGHHLYRAYPKLGVSKRTELGRIAL